MNEKHELTGWGRALRKALSSLDAPDKLEDSVYLAIELLRLGLLDERHVALGSTKAKAGKLHKSLGLDLQPNNVDDQRTTWPP